MMPPLQLIVFLHVMHEYANKRSKSAVFSMVPIFRESCEWKTYSTWFHLDYPPVQMKVH